MEKRASERVPYSLDAKIISAGKTYDGSIENVSEGGIEYLMTSLVETPKQFIPDKVIEINFQVPSGEILHLTCQVKWYLEIDPHDRKLMLGMKIIDPHQRYKELLRKLSN
jgi:hypothetical protein